MYPPAGAKLFLPVDLDGSRCKCVFELVHREPDRIVYWHLDERYLGQTKTFHQLSISLPPGKQTLLVVDEQGLSRQRVFEVLKKE